MSLTQFIKESEENLEKIMNIVQDMDEEELDEFGAALYYEFFDDEESEEDDYDSFSLEDVESMIKELGSNFYEDILDLLSEIDDEEEDLEEGVSRIMKQKNMNRKKRKFMSLSKAKLRQQAASRKKKNRSTKASRKRYYRANKQKIAAYQKSRRAAIKKGKHKVKMRRSAG